MFLGELVCRDVLAFISGLRYWNLFHGDSRRNRTWDILLYIDLFHDFSRRGMCYPQFPRIHYHFLIYRLTTWIHTYAQTHTSKTRYTQDNPVVLWPKKKVIHHGFKNNEKALVITKKSEVPPTRQFSNYIIPLLNTNHDKHSEPIPQASCQQSLNLFNQDQQRIYELSQGSIDRMFCKLKKDGGLWPLSIFRHSIVLQVEMPDYLLSSTTSSNPFWHSYTLDSTYSQVMTHKYSIPRVWPHRLSNTTWLITVYMLPQGFTNSVASSELHHVHPTGQNTHHVSYDWWHWY